MDNVKKNKTADVGKYSYQYVDIAEITRYLEDKHLSYRQYIDRLDGDDYITTKIFDENKNLVDELRGARICYEFLADVENPAQQLGALFTYLRRYSLLMAFGLATEDDDAQGFSKPKTERKATEKQIAYIKKLYGDLDEDFENMTAERASELISARR